MNTIVDEDLTILTEIGEAIMCDFCAFEEDHEDRPAEWYIVIQTICGHQANNDAYLCDPHYEGLINLTTLMCCNVCGAFAGSFRDMIVRTVKL